MKIWLINVRILSIASFECLTKQIEKKITKADICFRDPQCCLSPRDLHRRAAYCISMSSFLIQLSSSNGVAAYLEKAAHSVYDMFS